MYKYIRCVQEWCPNCKFFFKDFGLNNCELVDWKTNPLGGKPGVLEWLLENSLEDTTIKDDADKCPGFKWWKE